MNIKVVQAEFRFLLCSTVNYTAQRQELSQRHAFTLCLNILLNFCNFPGRYKVASHVTSNVMTEKYRFVYDAECDVFFLLFISRVAVFKRGVLEAGRRR